MMVSMRPVYVSAKQFRRGDRPSASSHKNALSCRRQGLPVLPCRACRTGTVAPGGGADRESRRRSERKPRQGRPDAAGARGAGSGMAGCRPGACGPRAIRAGRRTPARDHPAGPGSDRRPDAPERRGGPGRRGPGSPGYRRVRLPGASRPVPALRSATREARKNAHTPAVMHAILVLLGRLCLTPNRPFCAGDLGSLIEGLAHGQGGGPAPTTRLGRCHRLAVALMLAAAPPARSLVVARDARPAHPRR